MLNLGRTLGRFAGMPVPRLGDWSAVRFGDRLCVCSEPARPAHVAAPVRVAAARLGRTTVLDPAALVTLGASVETAGELLENGPVHVATVPLRAAGDDLGTLTVVRTAEFAEGDLALLQEVARRGVAALVAAEAYEERAHLARTLRTALIPPKLPNIPGVDLGARYRPAAEVADIGGDFYQVYACPDGRWAFEIGDVCGKGVEAAVLTGQVRQSLRTAVLVEPDPARALAVVNGAMIAIDGTRFVTLVHGHLRPESDGSLSVRLAGGGHPWPLVLRRDGTVDTVEAAGTIVGMLRQARFRAVDLRLAPGETLLLYTDGVTEAQVGGELLDVDRLAAMFGDCRGMSAQAIAERLEQMVLEYLSGGAHDDLALLAIRAEENA
ncbi:MAG: PP2C family protein-serine/threonine phosphatase [Sporichthyaceae bacterium]